MTHESSTDMNNHDSDSTVAKAACEHSAQLVTYLYGELPELDTASFTEHLASCATCNDEAAAFGQVRAQVNAVRLAMPDVRVSHAADFLDGLNAIHASTLNAPPNAFEATHDTRHTNDAPRSAWAALRELLALTPRSVQACAALTIIAICMLAMLALINAEVQWNAGGDFAFRTGLTRNITPDNTMPATMPVTASTVDPAIIERLVAERLEAELSRRADREQIASNGNQVKNEIESTASVVSPAAKPSTVEATLKPRTARTASPRAKRNTQRRRTLDAQPDEADVPRLYDLLGAAE